MKTLILVITLALAGCLVETGSPRRGTVYQESRSCPPAHHWEGGACVHNGNGRGHVRDHRD